MRKFNVVIGSLGLFLPLVLSAQTTSSNGSMGVTCTVDPSLGITITTGSSGLSLTGSGTSSTTATFGHVAAYGGSLATGLTRALTGETSTTYSTPFTIRVVKANLTSTNYTLAAVLGATITDHTVLIDTTDISSATSATTVNATQSYSTDISHTLYVTVLHSTVAPTINDAVTFTVTAN